MDERTFRDADGVEIFYRRWLARGTARGGVVVVHGASEHSGRYARFASVLATRGFECLALDQRGHGRTAAVTGKGHAGPRGMQGMLDDLAQLVDLARASVPGRPVILFGHSLGSMVAQAFVERPGPRLAGYVLSGSAGIAEADAAMLEGIRAAVAGGAGDQAVQMFGPFNAPFEPARTPYDWLSRDPDEVDRYVADPLCGDGVPLTFGFVAELLALGTEALSPEGIRRTPRGLPVLLVTGEMDPVSEMAARVRGLEKELRAAGLAVSARYYPGARHELLNEIEPVREQVHADILEWIEGVIANPGAARA